jgi:hypothetical protein
MAKKENKQGRPYRPRQLKDGRRVAYKRADARANAMPRKVFPVHAGAAKVLRKGVIDRRGTLGHAFYGELANLRTHIGGDPTLPLARLIEQGAMLHLLQAMAWAEVQTAGRLIRTDGTAHPALDVLLRTMRERREVLKLLGLERRAKPIPSLQEYLAKKATEKETQEEHVKTEEPTDGT